jgi:hypothetical protein
VRIGTALDQAGIFRPVKHGRGRAGSQAGTAGQLRWAGQPFEEDQRPTFHFSTIVAKDLANRMAKQNGIDPIFTWAHGHLPDQIFLRNFVIYILLTRSKYYLRIKGEPPLELSEESLFKCKKGD